MEKRLTSWATSCRHCWSSCLHPMPRGHASMHACYNHAAAAVAPAERLHVLVMVENVPRVAQDIQRHVEQAVKRRRHEHIGNAREGQVLRQCASCHGHGACRAWQRQRQHLAVPAPWCRGVWTMVEPGLRRGAVLQPHRHKRVSAWPTEWVFRQVGSSHLPPSSRPEPRVEHTRRAVHALERVQRQPGELIE